MAGYYNIRDLLGHWVRPKSRQDAMCPHACCRNKRVHPANMPVILPSRLLRRASDEDLAEHYRRVSRGHTEQDREAEFQVLFEMERRDKLNAERRARAERRAEIEQRRRDRWAADRASQQSDRAAIAEVSYLLAEEATRGNMLNKRGRALGVDERSLFTGPEARARAYASEELIEHWRTHPRPTAAMFQGKDTRVYERYTAPRRRPGRQLARGR